jgi:hypothetical protein
MYRAMGLLFGIAAVSLFSLPAEARDGCGSGWYFDGRGCVPSDGPTYSPYAPPMYAPPRGYYRGDEYAPRRNYRGYNDGAIRPSVGRNGVVSCGNPNYTFQDGACRPYRGR